jgi:hypothetical protein
MGRIGEPEEIADVIVLLASNTARYMTGQVVVVDGGLLVGRYRSRGLRTSAALNDETHGRRRLSSDRSVLLHDLSNLQTRC